ncbi:hypothetical protein KKD62_00715 [Patescibacteria group bacterium]|nr:hypothetical protein [Patescibacteria group bacterium]MBU1931456.1 hypothetical protein [Patescibacteria group bacterium]
MIQKYKKFLLAGCLILLAAGIGYLVFKPEKNQLIKPIGQQEKTAPKKFTFELIDWEDPAGFAFSYPQQLKLDPHEEDKINYSHLELSSDQYPGRIIIMVNDAKYPTIEDWLANEPTVQNGNALDTQVAEVTAKRIALPEGQEITAFIDLDQVIYLIQKEAADEIEFWGAVYKAILDSFKLTPLEGESEAEFTDWLQGFDTSQADVVESVEIIE